jgi:hypothetical protein
MKTIKLTRLEARFLCNLALEERNMNCPTKVNMYNCKNQKEYEKLFSALTNKLCKFDLQFYKDKKTKK